MCEAQTKKLTFLLASATCREIRELAEAPLRSTNSSPNCPRGNASEDTTGLCRCKRATVEVSMDCCRPTRNVKTKEDLEKLQLPAR